MTGCLKKLNSSRGFTLAEVLIAVLILLMVTAVVAGGIPVASNAYHKVVDAANAQVLLSTTMTELRDELSLATGVTVENNGKSVTYKSGSTGSTSRIATDSAGVQLSEYLDAEFADIRPASADRPLVSDKAATSKLHTEFTSIAYDPGTGLFTVTGLKVYKDSREVAGVASYIIRTVAAS